APDGTEPVYGAAVALASFAYVAAGVFVLMAALRRWVSPAAAFWTTVLSWAGSPLRFYLTVVPAMAHGIEFFAAALVLWTYVRLRATAGTAETAAALPAAAWCGVACGLVFLARSQDGLLLGLPLLELLFRLRVPAERPRVLRAGAALLAAFALTALPQVIVWRVMFGHAL